MLGILLFIFPYDANGLKLSSWRCLWSLSLSISIRNVIDSPPVPLHTSAFLLRVFSQRQPDNSLPRNDSPIRKETREKNRGPVAWCAKTSYYSTCRWQCGARYKTVRGRVGCRALRRRHWNCKNSPRVARPFPSRLSFVSVWVSLGSPPIHRRPRHIFSICFASLYASERETLICDGMYAATWLGDRKASGLGYHSRSFVGPDKAEYWLNRAARRLRAGN